MRKRLVKNGRIILDGTGPLYEKEKVVLKKFEELEDVEDTLGVDFHILVEALKYGIRIGKKKIHARNLRFGRIREWYLFANEDVVRVKDYGKTWTL